MRDDILLSILFDLLRERRVTAPVLAEKYSLSTRTVYRYIQRLSPLLPLDITRGRAGGITLADSYRLPVGFFTREEYAATVEALRAAYANTANEAFLSARRKLTTARKEERLPLYASLLVDCVQFFPAEGEEESCVKLRLLQSAIVEKRIARLVLATEEQARPVEALSLILTGSEWSLFAYCRTSQKSVKLPLREIRGVTLTEEYFLPRPSIL